MDLGIQKSISSIHTCISGFEATDVVESFGQTVLTEEDKSAIKRVFDYHGFRITTKHESNIMQSVSNRRRKYINMAYPDLYNFGPLTENFQIDLSRLISAFRAEIIRCPNQVIKRCASMRAVTSVDKDVLKYVVRYHDL